MCLICKGAYGATAISMAVSGVNPASINPERSKEILSKILNVERAEKAIKSVSIKIENPDWFNKEVERRKEAERMAAESHSDGIGSRVTSNYGTVVVSYSVSTRGNVRSDLAEFKRQIQETLTDSRGWARLGVKFNQVESGGRFQLILSEASLLPSFSSGCSAEWSCRVGSSVIINDNRWTQASEPWNASGGNLRDYRHMVINHEVGHWLGHGHYNCKTAGAKANVMQQQSIDLQGCAFNPWPLQEELVSTQLGIDKRK